LVLAAGACIPPQPVNSALETAGEIEESSAATALGSTEAEPDTETGVDGEDEPDIETDLDGEDEPDIETDSDIETDLGGEDEPDIETDSDTETDSEGEAEPCNVGESDCQPADLGCGSGTAGTACTSEYRWWGNGLLGATPPDGWVISVDPAGGQTYGSFSDEGVIVPEIDVLATALAPVMMASDTVNQLNAELPCHARSPHAAVICSSTAEQLEAGPHLVIVTEFAAPIWVDGGFALEHLVDYSVVLSHPTDPTQNITPPAGFEGDFLTDMAWVYRAAGLDGHVRGSFARAINGVPNVQSPSDMRIVLDGPFMTTIIPIDEFGSDFQAPPFAVSANVFGFHNTDPLGRLSSTSAGGDLATSTVDEPLVITIDNQSLSEFTFGSTISLGDIDEIPAQRPERDITTALVREFETSSKQALDTYREDGDLSAFANSVVVEFALSDQVSRDACEAALGPTLALANSFDVIEFPADPDLSFGISMYPVTLQVNYPNGPAPFSTRLMPGQLGDLRFFFAPCGS